MTVAVDNWENEDKLNRKESADFLSAYLTKRYALASKRSHADTFVLNIRADWGFGKTFFLQRWAKDLGVNHPVVFFDAWANDFCDDPLIGFIAEVNDALSKHFGKIPAVKRHLDRSLAVGRKLIKPVSLGIASVIAKQLSGYSLEKLNELYSQDSEDDDEGSSDGEGKPDKEISSLISKCAEVALKEHLSKKETIAIFKSRLGRLIETLQREAGVQLPLFVFIDELDRCRPTYAIELLEAVKHLFGVPGIYFIVATNLEQLGHSICAVYGEQFDAERYLKRFFDQEYLLPSPDNTCFTAFLFERYSLNDFGKLYPVIEAEIYGTTPSDQALFSIFSDGFGLGPRDQEQVASALQAILTNWPSNERIHLAYLLFLIIAKQVSTPLFQQLSENRFVNFSNFDEVLSNVLFPEALFKTRDIVSNERGASVTEHKLIKLLWAYQSYRSLSYEELSKKGCNVYKFPEKIISVINQDAPHDLPYGIKTLTPISDYSRRVSQAGQMIGPITHT